MDILTKQTNTEKRRELFKALIMREGEIKRGVLVSRMFISSQTFAREYADWLDYFDGNIKYDRHTRTFSYSP